jgi:hypothetical protein
MQIRQVTVQNAIAEPERLAELAAIEPQLVLVFAPDHVLAQPDFASTLKARFGQAQLVGCSGAGEIGMKGVSDGQTVVTALRFAQPQFQVASVPLPHMADSRAAGAALGQLLKRPDLQFVLVFSPGVDVNGSALIEGLAGVLGPKVALSGGLAGDGGKFTGTWTLRDGTANARMLVGIGFHGDGWQVAHGSFGGWQPFGPVRRVTRCENNVLYELDGQPALAIYRRYLGEYASGLPATGLLFPFAMLTHDRAETGLIRTILGVDEAQQSLILAGEIATDGYLRLMHASNDALVDGAEQAAQAAALPVLAHGAVQGQTLALLVSCVGRKLVMGGRVDEEIEAVGQVLGANAMLTGFYSNGEISPQEGFAACALHNQTMTITTLGERP